MEFLKFKTRGPLFFFGLATCKNLQKKYLILKLMYSYDERNMLGISLIP